MLDRLCRGDAALRAELDSLIDQFESDPDFLEAPPPGSEELGSSGTIDDDPLIGAELGAWRILSRIDRGGMGAVYLGQRSGGDFAQQAAVKVIARGMDSETIVARFQAERMILAALDHPNIASILDGGMTADGRPWFAMQYLEGASRIDSYCDDRRLSIKERLRLLLPVCAAVQFAHQNLVIHRDIKPANILVSSQDVPVLLDFGIAKMLSADHVLTGATRLFTPEFASPEQRSGEPVTTASDVYQLGGLLYVLLCGFRPELAAPEQPSDVLPAAPSARVDAEGARLRGESADSLRRKLRGDLDTICLKALHPEPQRRYRSAEALADDLQRVLDGLPVRARPDTLVYRAGKFLRRNRWSASFAAALFVVAIGFGAFASIAASRIAEQSKAVSLERDRARATADFLTDLFTLADPTRAERDYTAAEMLDRGLEKLSENERLSDRERNAVLAAVGGVFQVRGDHERARQVLAEAVELARRGGVAPRDHASSLLELAKAEYRLADYAASERLAREALDIIETLRGNHVIMRASALNQVAIALSDQGRLEEAAAMLEQVVEARQTLPDVDGRRNLAANLNNLGLIYSELGWLDQAEAAFDSALKIVEREFGPEHPYNAFLRHSRAELLELRGEFEQARTELRLALDTATRALGKEHPFVAQVKDDLAALRAGSSAP